MGKINVKIHNLYNKLNIRWPKRQTIKKTKKYFTQFTFLRIDKISFLWALHHVTYLLLIKKLILLPISNDTGELENLTLRYEMTSNLVGA